MLCDPTPDGWKYGFPKPYPYGDDYSSLIEWAIEEGYPRELAYASYTRYRFIGG